MRFLADMGVSFRTVEWLRKEGHDTVHLSELGLHRLPDRDVFARALAEERIVLTFDLDFGEIAALTAGKKAGVIIFRLRNTRAPHVSERLAAVLGDCVASLQAGAVVIVEESRHRVRSLPVGA